MILLEQKVKLLGYHMGIKVKGVEERLGSKQLVIRLEMPEYSAWGRTSRFHHVINQECPHRHKIYVYG